MRTNHEVGVTHQALPFLGNPYTIELFFYCERKQNLGSEGYDILYDPKVVAKPRHGTVESLACNPFLGGTESLYMCR